MEHIRSTVSYLMEASNTRYQNYMKTMLKERSVGKLMRGGGGGTYSTYQSGDLIMEGVRRAGHRFKMDRRTQGDGNCFPRAAKQQCDRPAVGINSIQCHEDLRRKVTDYMLQSEDRLVVDMRRRWPELEVRWSWETYWKKMARDGVWVEEVFVWATAWFLTRDIWIVWDTATPQTPLSFFSGDKGGNGTACPGVPLIIGHHTDTHYQSLLPEGGPVSDSFDTSSFAVELTKTLKRVWEAQKRTSRSKRKEPPRSDNDGADMEKTILNYSLEKPGVEAKRMQDGSVEYSCLLCATPSQQKQIASHMRKNHSSMFQENELEEFQGRLRKFAKVLADKRRTEKDPEGRKSAMRTRVYHAKRMAEDSEERKEYNRKKKAKGEAKKKEENSGEVKARTKMENDARKGNGEKKFRAEQKYGHIFPCACCHTMKSRDQVVELNPQQMDKIEGKAREYHQTLQVKSFICINTINIL